MENASCRSLRCFVLVLLVLLVQGASGRSARSFSLRSIRRDNKDTFQEHARLGSFTGTPAYLSPSTSIMLGIIPRGGFTVGATSTATAASAVLGLNGGLLLVYPTAVLRKIYNIEPSRQPGEAQLNNVLLRSMGVVSIGTAITLYSSIVLHRSLEVAVAYGLIPRMLCFVWILAFYRKTSFLAINTIMGSWCAFSLLTGLGTAPKTWKMFSMLSMAKGLALVVAPRTALNRLLGVTMIGDKAQALSKALGNEVAASALLMGSLAFGLNPIRAAASVCLLWIVLLANMAWFDKGWKLMDDRPRTQCIHMAIAALFATGFFASS